jgi:serine/threonine protein kinase
MGFVHCDVKPENILWTGSRRNSVKLIDFGCCCSAGRPFFTYVQSRFYRAPEVIMGFSYSTPVDVWSFACVICELITGRPLFPGRSESDQLMHILSVIGFPPIEYILDSPRRNVFFDDELRLLTSSTSRTCFEPGSKSLESILQTDEASLLSLIKGCLEWVPEKRLTMTEVVNHPWIREYGFKSLVWEF